MRTMAVRRSRVPSVRVISTSTLDGAGPSFSAVTPTTSSTSEPSRFQLAAFSPDSTKLAATDGTTLYVFDVDGYALAGQLVPDLSACPGAEMRELKWSRGGSILYGVYDCSDPSPSVVTWWVTEGL